MNESTLLELIRQLIAEKLGVTPDAIAPSERFRRLGVDSLTATSMLAAVGQRLGRSLSPTLAWQYPTPLDLAAFLAGGAGGAPSAPEALASAEGEPIAIVGLACRFPGAPDPERFWELVRDGVDAVREVPRERWDVERLFDRNIESPGKVTTRWGGFLDDVAGFDAQFFGISPREANEIDPQQRLMLELSWEALEDAGVPPHTLKDTRTGVFFGAMWGDYGRLPGATADRIVQHTATGRDLSIVPARVSYTLGLLGPSIAVNTACSSSLVAVHLARQSLVRGESRLALAGGVNLMLSAESTVTMSKFGAMAPDGRSKAFDARANGYVRGEGGGVVALKRLSHALADGDRVYCVIRGSALNNDGFSNGLTAPSPRAQEGVIRDACADAALAPSDVQYVEAHGTGTMLGDPIEAGALGAALGAGRPPEKALRIGSVKTNIGHLEAAAGVAGLIKVALSMHHRALPPTLHFQKPNPHIAFDDLGIRVQSSLEPWLPVDGRRTAGVSSFGFGGTNAHVLLQATEAPEVVLLFGGQGSQWLGMGRALLRGSARGRAALEQCDQAMRRLVPWSLVDRLLGDDPSALDRTDFVQPAIFALQVALAEELRARGVRFGAVVGQSMGEVAAAHVAGALSLDDAVQVICVRSELVARARGGGMVVTGLALDAATRAIASRADRLSVAVAAGPQNTVVAGDDEALVALQSDLEAEGVIVRPIRVDYASHSRFMDPLLPELRRRLATLRPRAADVAFWSTVTGEPLEGQALGADYWARNLREPVLFAPTVRKLADANRVFAEVDPHPVLAQFVEQTLAAVGRPASVLACGLRDEPEPRTLESASRDLRRAGCVVERAGAPGRPAELVVLSARTPSALNASAGRLCAHLELHPELTLADVAHGLLAGRSALEHRLAIVAPSRLALIEGLRAAVRGEAPAGSVRGEAREPAGKLAWLFTGQGAQVLGMGHGLWSAWPAFREAFEHACALIDPHLDRPLREVVWAAPGTRDAGDLDRTAYTQPALFAFEWALAALWRSWGIEPDLVAGHSVGEITAACVAGVFTLADAARLVCARGRLMDALPAGGAMVAVEAPEAEVVAAIASAAGAAKVSIAAVNGPCSVVIAGDEGPVLDIAGALARRGVGTRRLTVSHAFHSPLVEPMLTGLRHVAGSIAFRAPACALVSGLSGRLAGDEVASADYWVTHAREAVRFGDAVHTLEAAGVRRFVEIGPKATLLGLVPASAPRADLLLPTLRPGLPEAEAALEALASLHVAGHPLDPARFFPGGGPRARLPLYPWERERHWLEAPEVDERPSGGHPLLGRSARVHDAGQEMRVWETRLGARLVPWLADHVVAGSVVFPAAGYVELGLSALAELAPSTHAVVSSLEILEVLAIPEGGAIPLQVVARPRGSGAWTLQVATRTGETWTVHARAELRSRQRPPSPAVEVGPWRRDLASSTGPGPLYQAFSGAGLSYGSAFRGVLALRGGPRETIARVALPDAAGSPGAYQLHPALLDSCVQVMEAAVLGGGPAPWLPVRIQSVIVHARPSGTLLCKATLAPAPDGARERTGDLTIVDETGAVVAEVQGLTLRRAATSEARRAEDDWMFAPRWEPSEAPPQKVSGGRWLLVSGRTALADGLCASLEAAGACVARVDVEAAPEGVRRLLGGAFAGAPPTGIVHLRTVEPGVDPADIEGELVRGCDSVVAVVKGVAAMAWRDPPRLYVVTRGAQGVDGGDVRFVAAPLLGLARVVAMEHPELRCARIDLDPLASAGDVDALRCELLADDPEDEVAWRAGARHVLRLARTSVAGDPGDRARRAEPGRGRPFALRIGKPGVLGRLELLEVKRRPPGPGEVEIEVEAAGMNFRDVLLALGVVPDDRVGLDIEPGIECAGRVVAVGEGVLCPVAGDSVIALALRGAVASHVTTPASLVVRRPAAWTAAEAAGALLAPLTAWYALHKVGRLRAGERVLIHAAAGGVGLAAVQWAQHVGAEIIATAGSEDKRALLRDRGVRFISDSRSDRFVEDVRSWTNGEGVDVVLNSLSGDLIEKSFGLLRSYGRFIELGKRDYYANGSLGLRPFLQSLSFSLVDVHGMMADRPAWVGELLAELMNELGSGALAPLPTRAFPVSRAEEAFRAMAQGHHVGKLVLSVDDPQARIVPVSRGASNVRHDASYVVTGGLGGLGLTLAEWLAKGGAGHVVLVGRAGARAPAQRQAVARIEALGTRVTVAAADVADRAALAAVLDAIPPERPLRGVFHLAGVVDDGMLTDQSPARFRKVMAPKVLGAMNLHTLTAGADLDLFVMYSSVTGLLGSPGQSNYAAANSFLDALAQHRRAGGLPAVSVDWGVFAEVGMASQGGGGRRLEGRGMRSLSPAEGIAALERVLEHDPAQVAVCPIDVRQWVEFFPSAAASRMLGPLLAERPGTGRPAGDRAIVERLAAAEPHERPRLLEEVLREQVGQVLRISTDKIGRDVPLAKLGMDSLMGLELRNRVEALLGTRLPAGALWTFPTLAALAGRLAADGDAPAPEVRPDSSAAAAPTTDALVRDVAEMGHGDLMSFVDTLLERANPSSK